VKVKLNFKSSLLSSEGSIIKYFSKVKGNHNTIIVVPNNLCEILIKKILIHMKLRIKSTKTTILILGIYQVIGAIAGFCIIAWLLSKTQAINGPVLLIFLTATGLYYLSMKAGTALIRKDYKRGLILSMLNQIMQVLAVSVGGYKYDFFSGAKLTTGFNFTEGFLINFDFGLISQFNLSWNTADQEYYLFVNILAIFLIYLIVDIYEEVFEKNKSTEPIVVGEVHEISKDEN